MDLDFDFITYVIYAAIVVLAVLIWRGRKIKTVVQVEETTTSKVEEVNAAPYKVEQPVAPVKKTRTPRAPKAEKPVAKTTKAPVAKKPRAKKA
jgi:hypothetical protein